VGIKYEPVVFFIGVTMQKTRFLKVTPSAVVPREATFEDRKYLVVPVVALVEGVIQAMNASTPEFVAAEEYSKFPASWNNRPVVVDHPVVDGEPVSANTPAVLTSHRIGMIFNSSLKKGKLCMEAWIDIERAEKLEPEMLKRLQEGDPIEISVGLFCETDESTGEFGGKKFAGAWKDLVPDHLALLSKGSTGACSREMGCGVRAAIGNGNNQYTQVNGKKGSASVSPTSDKEYRVVHTDGTKTTTTVHSSHSEAVAHARRVTKAMSENEIKGNLFSRILSSLTRAAQPAGEMSSTDLTSKLYKALKEIEPNVNYVEVFLPVTNPTRVVYSCYFPSGTYGVESSMGYQYVLFERAFTLGENGVVTLGENRVEVEPTLSYEPVLMAEEPVVAEAGDMKDAVGKRNSAADQKKIQAMHDHALALGAKCATPKMAGAAEGTPCGCHKQKALSEEKDMSKEAIVKALETASPDQIKAMTEAFEGTNPAVKAAAEATAQAAADVKAANEKAAADVKAAQDKAAADVKAAQEDPEYVAFKAAADDEEDRDHQDPHRHGPLQDDPGSAEGDVAGRNSTTW
jgi:hypothetical protein